MRSGEFHIVGLEPAHTLLSALVQTVDLVLFVPLDPLYTMRPGPISNLGHFFHTMAHGSSYSVTTVPPHISNLDLLTW